MRQLMKLLSFILLLMSLASCRESRELVLFKEVQLYSDEESIISRFSSRSSTFFKMNDIILIKDEKFQRFVCYTSNGQKYIDGYFSLQSDSLLFIPKHLFSMGCREPMYFCHVNSYARHRMCKDSCKSYLDQNKSEDVGVQYVDQLLIDDIEYNIFRHRILVDEHSFLEGGEIENLFAFNIEEGLILLERRRESPYLFPYED